ncbi:MAG: hypothetical protein V1796_03345, partial [Pseudomonadota bacterium]
MIGWAVPEADELASYRYRCKIPMRELGRMGVECRMGKGSITVCSKHFLPLEDAVRIKKISKIVYDISDDHFGGRWDEHYRTMIDMADAITCPTEAMAGRILEETGRAAHVVTDPYEFQREEPQMPSGTVTNLLWFGHQLNLPGLIAQLPRLGKWNLRVVSNAEGYIPWSLQTMYREFANCDVVIIPVPGETRKQVKSPNRMVESIRQGRFVVANPMPAYAKYGMWQGDLVEGLEWIAAHKDAALTTVCNAQRVIEASHSPRVVAEQWKRVFERL